MSKVEPLKITAHPRCGIITDAALPLDGILYAIKVQEEFGARHASAIRSSNVPADANGRCRLPFARHNNHTPQWFYACSWAQWEGATEGSDHWNKRFDLNFAHLLAPKKGKLAISEGRYKSYHMPIFYRHALSVSWYCIGDKAELERLLKMATHLGKKTSQGWGEIIKWQVDQWAEDWSVRNANGKLMRAIPAAVGVVMGIRPSYWNPRHQFLCAKPEGI